MELLHRPPPIAKVGARSETSDGIGLQKICGLLLCASVPRLLDSFCASCARISWIVMMRVSPSASTVMPSMVEAARLSSSHCTCPGGERRVGELRPCAMMSERVSVRESQKKKKRRRRKERKQASALSSTLQRPYSRCQRFLGGYQRSSIRIVVHACTCACALYTHPANYHLLAVAACRLVPLLCQRRVAAEARSRPHSAGFLGRRRGRKHARLLELAVCDAGRP